MSSAVDTFFEKFGELADDTSSLARLRKLILQFAAQGSLIGDSSTYRTIPLGDLGRARMGKTILKKELQGSGVPVYSAGRENRAWGYLEDSDLIFRRGTIVISARGTIGFPRIPDEEQFVSSQTTIAFETEDSNVDVAFLRMALDSVDWEGMTSRNAIPMITVKRVNAIKVCLPPLAEQKRIVAKVDALMAQCDRLEEQLRERDTRQAELARAALARFAEAPTPANLNLLFDPLPHSKFNIQNSTFITPADLRKTILTLAVQGKLVPQDLKDEPAERSVAKLAEDRARLVAAKQLPKIKPLDEPKDPPFDLPESWTWVQLGAISHLIEYGTSQKSSDNTTHVPVYRMGDIQGGSLSDANLKYVPPGIDDLPKLFLDPGDILFNRTNSAELVGKAAIFKGTSNTHTFASYLIRVRIPADHINPDFTVIP